MNYVNVKNSFHQIRSNLRWLLALLWIWKPYFYKNIKLKTHLKDGRLDALSYFVPDVDVSGHFGQNIGPESGLLRPSPAQGRRVPGCVLQLHSAWQNMNAPRPLLPPLSAGRQALRASCAPHWTGPLQQHEGRRGRGAHSGTLQITDLLLKGRYFLLERSFLVTTIMIWPVSFVKMGSRKVHKRCKSRAFWPLFEV